MHFNVIIFSRNLNLQVKVFETIYNCGYYYIITFLRIFEGRYENAWSILLSIT